MSDDPPKPKHEHDTLVFPENFLWGAATSAFQVEGNNIHSDWWSWEQTHQPPEFRSGLAANQYNLYEQDFDLAKSLGHNAHRLSIEWARIEPNEGEFDLHEIEHYQKELKALKDRGFIVMLTLWHFTLPNWVANKGGWENSQTAFYFERFVKRVVPEIKDYVDFWITLNEPTTFMFNHFINRIWPGANKAWIGKIVKTYLNLVSAHKKAYKAIHLNSNSPVGIANNVQSFEPYHMHSLIEVMSVLVGDLINNHSFYILSKKYHDFFGINYYQHVRFKSWLKFKELETMGKEGQGYEVSDLGWEIYPEGIFDVLSDLSNHLPVYITECGIASTNDDRRTRFLIHYLQEVYRAIKLGVKVKGFFYWSLIDNMELSLGYDPRFGLIEVDFKTQKRTPRPSAYVYKDIIENNGIRHKLLKLLGHGFRVEEVLPEIGIKK